MRRQVFMTGLYITILKNDRFCDLTVIKSLLKDTKKNGGDKFRLVAINIESNLVEKDKALIENYGWKDIEFLHFVTSAEISEGFNQFSSTIPCIVVVNLQGEIVFHGKHQYFGEFEKNLKNLVEGKD